LAARPPKSAARLDAAPLGKLLEANRMVFGTYAVTEGQATLSAQVLDISREVVLLETRVGGSYERVLDLERELARRLRAHFLGEPVESVPLKDIAQWTTKIGAAEHLYVGVDLFDRGQFAEAWLRFRQAARADPAYTDPLYWQGRMLYYLMLYENAQPLLDRFFTRWPKHPRAGDAAIEVLDSYRQTESDPRVLREVYARLRDKVDPRTVVHNKATAGAETQTPLRTYIGGFLVQAERALGHYDAAADLAITLQQESREAYRRSGVHKRHWGFYEPLAMFAGIERRMMQGKLRFDRQMINPQNYRGAVIQPEPADSRITIPGGRRWIPLTVERNERYYIDGLNVYTTWLIAPEGYVFDDDVAVRCWFHHEQGTPAFLVSVSWGLWIQGESDKFLASSDKGQGTATIDLPPNTPMFCVTIHLLPDRFGGTAGTNYFLKAPYADYVERTEIRFALKPQPKNTGHIRVELANVEKARVFLDGRSALLVDGVIRDVDPGEHTLAAYAAKSKSLDRSSVYDPIERKVVVEAGKTTDVRLEFPFSQVRSMALWTTPQAIGGRYPAAKLPPKTGEGENCPPCLLRVRRGPLTGRLVALWSHREELWASYSMDDGDTWTPIERLPIPVNSAHHETAPQLIQDEQGRFCLMFVSDRNTERSFYPYATWSWDLERWTAPGKVADVVCDSLSLIQNDAGEYLALLPPPFQGTDWGVHLRKISPTRWQYETVDIATAYGKKYARKSLRLFRSGDFTHWHETECVLGGEGVRDACLLQADDGLYHAVYTRMVFHPTTKAPIWSVLYQTSPDMLTWTPEKVLLQAPWDYRNPVITTDGRRVFGSIVVSGNNVHRFNVGTPDEVGWWGFVSTQNVMMHDPPEFGARLHWLWICYEGTPAWYQPNAGKVYYSRRPSDRGEWLLTWPKTLPPDTPEQKRRKEHVLAMADLRAIPPGKPWRNPVEHRNPQHGYTVTVPADWTALEAPQQLRYGYLCPERYGFLQPYFDVFIWDTDGTGSIEALGRIALRRWVGWKGQDATLRFIDHPCGQRAYELVYQAPWSMDQPIVTRTIGMLRHGKEYRLNARCPVAAVEEWMPVLNRMLESFRLVPRKQQ